MVYARHRQYAKNGTFFSIEDATRFVNEILNENQNIVDQVAEGKLKQKFILKRYSIVTGREFIRDDGFRDPYPQPTFGVGVYIRHTEDSPKKYYLVTAYPTNKEIVMEPKSFEIPYAFKKFAFFVDQESWACRTMDDLAKHGLRGLEATDVNSFVAFVRRLETLTKTDLNLEEFWNASPSEVFLGNHEDVLSFLKRAAEIAVTEGIDFEETGDAENTVYVKRCT